MFLIDRSYEYISYSSIWTLFTDIIIYYHTTNTRRVWYFYQCFMNSTYFTQQQLEDLTYCLLLSLLDPRAIMVYDLICNVLAAVISSMQQRGL